MIALPINQALLSLYLKSLFCVTSYGLRTTLTASRDKNDKNAKPVRIISVDMIFMRDSKDVDLIELSTWFTLCLVVGVDTHSDRPESEKFGVTDPVRRELRFSEEANHLNEVLVRMYTGPKHALCIETGGGAVLVICGRSRLAKEHKQHSAGSGTAFLISAMKLPHVFLYAVAKSRVSAAFRVSTFPRVAGSLPSFLVVPRTYIKG